MSSGSIGLVGLRAASSCTVVAAFIVQVTDRLALMRIKVDCHPALAYTHDMTHSGNSPSHRLFIVEASLSLNLI